MLFSTLPELHHPDALLRQIEAADLETWASYLKNPLVYEHTSWNLGSSAELAPHLWQGQTPTPDSMFRLAIACRSTGLLIGTIGFHTVSALNKSAELAYDLSPAVWGKGIASAATIALIGWAHEHAGMIRVQATVLESNAKSMRVLERCGFAREGLLKSYRQVRGKAGNFWMYADIRPGGSSG